MFHEISDTGLQGRDLEQALKELQNVRYDVVAGAAADTNINVAGIAVDDTIVAVLELGLDVTTDDFVTASGSPDTTAAAVTDVTQTVVKRTAEAAITSAGHVQLDTTDTTGKSLLIVWNDKPTL